MNRFESFFQPENFATSRAVDVVTGLGPLLAFAAFSASLFYAPTEQVMGDVQRIFYFHVGSAMACYLMVAVCFVAGVLFLVTRSRAWDLIGEASASVAFVFSGAVLLTGMIWGHSAWNTWWRWEPRLVSFLILWLVLLGAVTFRRMMDHTPSRASLSASVGILAAINIPLIVFSVKLLERTEQLHPQVLADQGLRDSGFVYTLIGTIIALSVFATSLFFQRLGNAVLAASLEDIYHSRDKR